MRVCPKFLHKPFHPSCWVVILLQWHWLGTRRLLNNRRPMRNTGRVILVWLGLDTGPPCPAIVILAVVYVRFTTKRIAERAPPLTIRREHIHIGLKLPLSFICPPGQPLNKTI